MVIELTKILLIIIFVIIGASVFFLASLISGTNIYKDHNNKFSDLASVLIGAIPFILLPIGFIIITPDFFIKDFYKLVDLHEMILQVHKLILKKALVPFLLTCVGFGIVVGCTQSLSYRLKILRKFRELTNININIMDYVACWDQFLRRIKPNANIEVKLQDGTIVKGNKWIFSIRDEKTALTLKHARLDSEPSSSIIIMETCIEYIGVKENAFKKHYEITDRPAQAFYHALFSVGLSLVVFSIYMTFNYFEQMIPTDVRIQIQKNHINWYTYLAEFYGYVWWVLWILTACIVLLGFHDLRKDFKCYISSFVFFPLLGCLLWGMIPLVFILLWMFIKSHHATTTWLGDYIDQIVAACMTLAIAAVINWLNILSTYFGITACEKSFIARNDSNNGIALKKYLKPIVYWLCRERNLNADNDTDEYNRLKIQLKKIGEDVTDIKRELNLEFESVEINYYKEAIEAFFAEVDFLTENEKDLFGKNYLKGEELNIIEDFNHHLKK